MSTIVDLKGQVQPFSNSKDSLVTNPKKSLAKATFICNKGRLTKKKANLVDKQAN